MKRTIAFVGALLIASAILHADLYLRIRENSSGSPMNWPIIPDDITDPSVIWERQYGSFHLVGTPTKKSTMELWIGDRASSCTIGHKKIVYDCNKNKLYIVNNANKTYFEADMPFGPDNLFHPEIRQTATAMRVPVAVTANGKTKTIGRWRCSGYSGTSSTGSLSATVTIWATTDVDAAVLKYLKDAISCGVNIRDMLGNLAAISENTKIDGIPVATDITLSIGSFPGGRTVPNVHQNTKVVMIARRTPPADTYAVPVGYKRVDSLAMKDMKPRGARWGVGFGLFWGTVLRSLYL